MNMITNYTLSKLGYTQAQCASVMFKLNKLNIKSTKINTRHTYIRNGLICDYMIDVKAYPIKEGVEALLSTKNERWVNVANAMVNKILPNEQNST